MAYCGLCLHRLSQYVKNMIWNEYNETKSPPVIRCDYDRPAHQLKQHESGHRNHSSLVLTHRRIN